MNDLLIRTTECDVRRVAWTEDVLNSLPKSVREDITERAHERALRNRGE